MFKRELKCNLKSFIIWTAILIVMFLIVFLVYPSITNGENIKAMDEMMKAFPKELLEAFNMDITSMTTVYGWLKSEGFVFVILIIGCYAGILGSSILLKEESDKTIEYVNSLPIKRRNIVLSKTIAGLIYIILMVIILGLFNYVCLMISGDLDHKQYILLSLTPILSSIVIYTFCMFISTFAHKTKKVLGLSLGIVFISYILQTLSSISENVEFLKYASAFTLADVRNVIIDSSINPIMVIISVVISIIFIILTIIRYERKDLIA